MHVTITPCSSIVTAEDDSYTREIIYGDEDDTVRYLINTCGEGSLFSRHSPVTIYVVPVRRVALHDASGDEIDFDFTSATGQVRRAEKRRGRIVLAGLGIRPEIRRLALAGCGLRAQQWLTRYPDLIGDPAATLAIAGEPDLSDEAALSASI